jgi:signal transduction histidine kinase/CheY-like chemotaxis protein
MQPLPPIDASLTRHDGTKGPAATAEPADQPAASGSEPAQASTAAIVRLPPAAPALGLGTWDRDLIADTLTWDDAMFRLFGRHPEEAAPRAIFIRQVHAEDRARVHADHIAAVRSAAPCQTEFRIVLPGGEVRWLAMRGVVERGLDGAPARLLGFAWDTTESRRAEEAARARETAERARRANSIFLTRMCRELRTPLNAIAGLAQLLERDTAAPLGPGQHERVAGIHAAAWHLMRLVNDVLDLSRIETGSASPAMQIVALEPLIAASVAMVRSELAPRDLQLAQSLDPEAPRHAWADGRRLQQVLLNLLTNAIRYNRPGGAISLQVQGRGSDQVAIVVQDTGRGMSAAQRAQLFQPFNRLGQESVEPAGIGIGLAISQRLVARMRGSLEVDSEPGRGSTFRVVLNAARIEPDRVDAPASIGRGRGRRPLQARDDIIGRVLYIENHPTSSALLEQLLHFRPGITLYKAQDDATGLVLASACRPDLLLLDLRAPDADGLSLLRQLREQAETRQVPCVAVSANARADDIRVALDSGFADYWTRPLDAEQLLAGIDRHLSAASAAVDEVPRRWPR